MISHYDENGNPVYATAKEVFMEDLWKQLAAEDANGIDNSDSFDFNKLVQFLKMAYSEMKALQAVLECLLKGEKIGLIEASQVVREPAKIASSCTGAILAAELEKSYAKLNKGALQSQETFRNDILPLYQGGWRLGRDEAGWKVAVDVDQLLIPTLPLGGETSDLVVSSESASRILFINHAPLPFPESAGGDSTERSLFIKQLSLISRRLFDKIYEDCIQGDIIVEYQNLHCFVASINANSFKFELKEGSDDAMDHGSVESELPRLLLDAYLKKQEFSIYLLY